VLASTPIERPWTSLVSMNDTHGMRSKRRGLPRPGPVFAGLAAATAVCAAVFVYNDAVLSESTPAVPSAELVQQRVGGVAAEIGSSVALTGAGGLTNTTPGANAVTTCLDPPGRLPGAVGAIAP
jgi:hypothetical protein